VNLLLDTQAILWWKTGSRKLGSRARRLIETDAQTVLVSVTVDHAVAVASLPLHHADPFDRLLIAQARAEGLTILTSDEAFDAYDIPVVDARA
jgi:PIN domain nuclease of toxin-antitoxin system